MAYQLEDINLRTVTDPRGFVEEGDAIYAANVERAAELIAQNRKRSRSRSNGTAAPGTLAPTHWPAFIR